MAVQLCKSQWAVRSTGQLVPGRRLVQRRRLDELARSRHAHADDSETRLACSAWLCARSAPTAAASSRFACRLASAQLVRVVLVIRRSGAVDLSSRASKQVLRRARSSAAVRFSGILILTAAPAATSFTPQPRTSAKLRQLSLDERSRRWTQCESTGRRRATDSDAASQRNTSCRRASLANARLVKSAASRAFSRLLSAPTATAAAATGTVALAAAALTAPTGSLTQLIPPRLIDRLARRVQFRRRRTDSLRTRRVRLALAARLG